MNLNNSGRYRQKLLAQIVLLLIGGQQVVASGLISGRVKSARTGEGIADVHVIARGTTIGAATDADGHFTLSVPAGRYSLVAHHIAFFQYTVPPVDIQPGDSVWVAIDLTPHVLLVEEIEVEGNRADERTISSVDQVQMSAREVVTLPGALDDPMRAMQIISGTGGSDFNAFLTVRGSNPSQNQVVLDGIVIPNPYRLRIAMGAGSACSTPK